MSIKKSLTTAAIALVGILAVSQSASAATLTYTNGDLFLGFRATTGPGAENAYLINIGQASIFRDATSAITLNLGDLGVDLTSFGDWTTDGDVMWGVFGATSASGALNGDPRSTLYGSVASIYDSGTDTLSSGQAWTASGRSAQQLIQGKYSSLAGTYNGQTSSANGNFTLVQAANTTNGWVSWVSKSADFDYFNNGIEGSFANGLSGAGLDLFRIVSTENNGGLGEVTNEGRFTIDGSGVVTFTPVPEPSTWAMLGVGAVVLGVIARRRKAALQA